MSINIPGLVNPKLIQSNGRPVPRFCEFADKSLKVGTEALPVRSVVKQALFDFDGTLVRTEFLRQLGWLLTALKPQYVDYFGGTKALKEFVAQCKAKGTGPFQDAIGAAEDQHQQIIAEVAIKCRRMRSAQQNSKIDGTSKNLDIEKFRADRNELVKDLMKRHSFMPNIGMWEVFSLLQVSKTPLMIVTQSKRETVLQALKSAVEKEEGPETNRKPGEMNAWQKLCGKNFENILMVCFDDLKHYGLQRKPSPQPYRFATCLLALMQSREGPDRLTTPISSKKPTEQECQIAASLAIYKPDSDALKDDAIELMGVQRAREFFKYLPNSKEVFIVEDTTTGLQAGEEFTTVFVENGVGASHDGRPFIKNPVLQSNEELESSLYNFQKMASQGARTDYLTEDLRGVSDLLRESLKNGVALMPADQAKAESERQRQDWDKLESYINQGTGDTVL